MKKPSKRLRKLMDEASLVRPDGRIGFPSRSEIDGLAERAFRELVEFTNAPLRSWWERQGITLPAYGEAWES